MTVYIKVGPNPYAGMIVSVKMVEVLELRAMGLYWKKLK